jgi:hypothetical protein
LKKRFIALLERWLNKAYSSQNWSEWADRTLLVQQFLYEKLPKVWEGFQGLEICEGGRWNYYLDPNKSAATIDFVVPKLPLFVIVGRIESASWDIAKSRGVARKRWEEWQGYYDALVDILSSLPSDSGRVRPIVLYIPWGASVDPSSLYVLLKQKATSLPSTEAV